MPFDKRTLRKELEYVLCKDRYYLERRLRSLPAVDHKDFSHHYNQIKKRMHGSQQKVENRKKSIPEFDYPKELPITSAKTEICEAIRNNQVTVITGETGSGKTTQIPKMCLEAGRGVTGKVVCTQPRRIAATSLSSQVAKELGTTVGDKVGFKIRFSDKSQESTLIQFVTDGLLLAEIQGDRYLSEYDTIVIDEAHERTLNIDFLLGYLKQLLPKRPDLKLIITSATIDIDKFSKAFPQIHDNNIDCNRVAFPDEVERDNKVFNAPIISVSGRMYPVEVRYFPIDEIMEEQGDQTMIDLVQEAVEDLLTESDFGDILVFMSGVQEIREAADRFTYLKNEGFHVLPLFGRLTIAEQNRIFKKSSQRKIILSTNIAETSITVPGIHYVVDTGRARISQYNSRTGTQGLPVKAISQSSADQRKGRCGRISNGVCIRLYSKEDYINRDEYTTPEIQRSNLSEVILRMLSLRLGEVETFPFIDPPESAQIRAGFRTLRELGALNEKRKLTTVGREMASLPVDPRTARMILQAKYERVVYPVLIIASAISCQDPREKPEDKKTQAEQKHARFKSKESDLISMLNLWEEYHSTLEELKSQGKMRKFCKANFLSYNRIREWRDIYSQLKSIAIDKKWETKSPDNFDYDAIHKSILAGYLPHIAKLKEKKTYQGTKNRDFLLFPGSDQYQSRHQWIVAIELLETAKLYAHTIAKIDSEWLEPLAGNLCKKTWTDPRWDKKSQRVVAIETVTLFGFCLVNDRKVFYGKINRNEANRIFIREALIAGEFESDLPFWKHNQKLIEEIEHEEAKTRSKTLLVDDDTLEAFYTKRIQGVACLNDLKKLIKRQGGDKFLFMEKKDLLRQEVSDNSDMFPTHLKVGDHNCRLRYVFEPGHEADGITIELPGKLLGSVREEAFEYLVPGLLKEKIYYLLKSLPKEIRKKLVPIPEKAESIWEEMTSLRHTTAQENTDKGFFEVLTDAAFKVTRVHIDPQIWNKRELPDYLRMNFAIKKRNSKEFRYSRNLDGFIKQKSKPKDNWDSLVRPFERWEINKWDFEPLMEKIELAGSGDISIWGFRTLVLKEKELMLTVVKSESQALEENLKAVPQLIARNLGDELAWLHSELRFPPESLFRYQYLWKSSKNIDINTLSRKYDSQKNQAQRTFHENMQQQAYDMVFEGLCGFNGDFVLTQNGFNKKIESIKRSLKGLGAQVVGWVGDSLEIYHQLLLLIEKKKLYLTADFLKRIREELACFFPANCLQTIPFEQWKHCPRILKCYLKRIERHLEDPQDENFRHTNIEAYQQRSWELISKPTIEIQKAWIYKRYLWMVEELKVSEFAQGLTTAFPISPKRIDKFVAKFW